MLDAVPVHVHGLDPREADVNGAIDGRARRRQDAGDLERVVVVVAEAFCPDAVGNDQFVVQDGIRACALHFCAEDGASSVSAKGPPSEKPRRRLSA